MSPSKTPQFYRSGDKLKTNSRDVMCSWIMEVMNAFQLFNAFHKRRGQHVSFKNVFEG